MSNKQKKKVNRLTIAELKNLVAHPDMVEMWDVTAADPRLLLFLKAYRNTVPVPRHWNQKRKYLQAKRGQEKPSYDLPDYIAQTGIADVRQTFVDDEKSSKQKQRERVRPKMGKMDLEYQVLFDAFFKHQTKPRLSNFGDQYYEGRELEIHMKEKKPGHLSDELKVALGMVEGGPTPWLINMQRYGPPPSYPNLRIGGLNAPIPKGAQWGYQPGGWGKPPIDEQGNPLYGDVFGINEEKEDEDEPPIDRTRWGELGESESEEEDEEEDEGEEEDEQGGVDESGMSSVTTYDSGMETPDAPSTINLRKMSGMETPETPLPPPSANTGEQPQLFTVLEEKKTKVGASLMGGSHVYVMNKDKKAGDVDVALQPGELEELQEGGEEFLQQKLEEKMAEEARANAGEDYSDIMAEESLKRKRKEDKKKEMKKLKKF
uniref:PSP proline-rich domain-containing protein n=1 Tax=Palpitomonas bilix TaxID=652834 RepID=A0A7S3D8M6_9EUKA|mmetsp:Transcript_27035/g.69557  ORF Transcript_27035/g.69557 Transcript_27035/m.69557 type:complete len:431 (+) Transcript_27035:439-1731(+)